MAATALISKQRPSWHYLVLGIALLGVLVLSDMASGPSVTLGPFYLVPLCIVAWWGGSTAGVCMGLLTLCSWILVQFHDGIMTHVTPLFFVNMGIRLLFNSIVAFVLPAWRDVGQRLERMVAERTAALHVLAADLSAAEDAQRRQLAHDIHDALGQNLSLLRIDLESIARDLPDQGSADGLRSRVSAEVQMIDSLIQQTRTLTFDLYPPMLDDLGLAAALEGYADEFTQRTKADVTFSQVGTPHESYLAKPVSHYLFRSVRELMANAVRHGHAKEIVISLHWQTEGMRLTVDDDGSGLDETSAADLKSGSPRRGLGLAGIRQRLNAMGGEMQVESRENQGTRVILQLPIGIEVKTHNESRVHSLHS